MNSCYKIESVFKHSELGISAKCIYVYISFPFTCALGIFWVCHIFVPSTLLATPTGPLSVLQL